MRLVFLTILISHLVTAFSYADNHASAVSLEKGDQVVAVKVNGKLFTNYVYNDKKRAKPILYPVIGPNEVPMTRRYPIEEAAPGEAKDHPHHASLWYTHGEVNGISFWHVAKNTGTILHEKFLKLEGNTIVTRNKWVGPKGEIVCKDETTLAFFAEGKDRAIDVSVKIIAAQGDVTFGDTKEGSMGIRSNPTLRLKGSVAKGKAINSEGVEGRAIWGKRAAWVSYSAPFKSGSVGFSIFDHPTNLRHPTWWHARDYGLVAANPFGIHNFERKPKGTGNLKILKGSDITFKYRFLFHEGDAEGAKIAERYAKWAKASK
tara:strand:- start:857 stop:1807 length:951 start_codon:yes stop_codon:yes gene_type:complete